MMDNLILSIIFFSHPKPLPRVLISQYISLLPHRDMGINLCDVNRTVSEHFLNVADVYIGFQKAGGEGVAEHVRGDVQAREQYLLIMRRTDWSDRGAPD